MHIYREKNAVADFLAKKGTRDKVSSEASSLNLLPTKARLLIMQD